MNALEKVKTIWQKGKTNTEEALKLFDELDTVEKEFTIGRWKGSGLHTDRPME